MKNSFLHPWGGENSWGPLSPPPGSGSGLYIYAKKSPPETMEKQSKPGGTAFAAWGRLPKNAVLTVPQKLWETNGKTTFCGNGHGQISSGRSMGTTGSMLRTLGKH